MYIHQDGKTNIINGNCFDENVMKEVKKQKPTVGFLNPPYKGDKKNDIEEFEFILNNLAFKYFVGVQLFVQLLCKI